MTEDNKLLEILFPKSSEMSVGGILIRSPVSRAPIMVRYGKRVYPVVYYSASSFDFLIEKEDGWEADADPRLDLEEGKNYWWVWAGACEIVGSLCPMAM